MSVSRTAPSASASATASAVATAWANGLVSAPSVTATPPSRRRPAQADLVKYAAGRSHAPATPMPRTLPMTPSAICLRRKGIASEARLWKPTWQASPVARAAAAMCS
jgi:hypothetical protein